MKIWQIMTVSAAAAVTLPALAQMTPPTSPAPPAAQTRADVEAKVRDRLGRFDADKNGTVTPEEMKSYAETQRKARTDDRFAAMDTDKNGAISRDEFFAAGKDRDFFAMPQVERYGGSNGKPWPNARRQPLAPNALGQPQPAPGPDGKLVMRERTRIMMMGGRDGMMMMQGDGKGIVIADAVKKALERFDAADTDKDGKISPDERKAQRSAWRMKIG